jgi:glycosyltransferase involved in cell wall biosynthesis
MGGSEIQIYHLIKEFKKKGYEIHYLYDSNLKISKRNGEVQHHLLHDYTRSFSWLNFLKIGILIKKISPDIIYQRSKSAYTGISAFFAKLTSTKMVYNISSDTDCLKKNTAFPRFINHHLGNYGIKTANLIIAQTRHQQNLLKNNFDLNSTLISNGHPIPNPPFKKQRPPVISWIANIKPLKQPEIFIKLAEKCQDLEARFVYAGRPTTGKYKKILTKKTKKIPNLTYLGEIPFEKTNELLSRTAIFINTSLSDKEGFPNTYIQAWMRETPVVTLNCDPDNIIRNKRIGFHSGSFENLVRDVRYLVENEDIRGEMGKKAREYAINNHDIEKIGNKYFNVFQRMLNK